MNKQLGREDLNNAKKEQENDLILEEIEGKINDDFVANLATEKDSLLMKGESNLSGNNKVVNFVNISKMLSREDVNKKEEKKDLAFLADYNTEKGLNYINQRNDKGVSDWKKNIVNEFDGEESEILRKYGDSDENYLFQKDELLLEPNQEISSK